MVVPLADDSRLDGGHVNNIVHAYRKATDTERVQGKHWYITARRIALDIHPNGIGMVAALSPAMAWDMNVTITRELADTGDCSYQSGVNKAKAIRIMRGEAPEDVLGGNKVLAFYRSIESQGDADSPCIDRHAFSVWLGQKTTDKRSQILTDRKGAYEIVADAYRKAAEILDVKVDVVQAVTWISWRNAIGATA